MCFVDRSCLNVYDADENIFFFLEIASLIGPICSAFSPPLPLPPPPPPTCTLLLQSLNKGDFEWCSSTGNESFSQKYAFYCWVVYLL